MLTFTIKDRSISNELYACLLTHVSYNETQKKEEALICTVGFITYGMQVRLIES